MEGDPPLPPAPPSVDAGPAINAPLVTAILIELRGSEAKKANPANTNRNHMTGSLAARLRVRVKGQQDQRSQRERHEAF